jgi:hypothetical protein
MIALQAAGIVALVGGVILVARAPVLSSLRPVLPHRDPAPDPGERSGPAPGKPAHRPEREEV